MKVCSVEDITGASGAPNLGSIPSRPVSLLEVQGKIKEIIGSYKRYMTQLRGNAWLVDLIDLLE